METTLFFFFIVGYWSIAVSFLAIGMTSRGEFPISEVAVVSIFWPLFGIFYALALLWRAAIKSAHTMRVDLKNRRLMGEFETWLRERDAQKDGETK